MNRLSRIFTSSFKLATSDIANQYALPVKSVTGYAVSKKSAKSSFKLNKTLIEKHMDVKPDDYILEIGYGRGDAMKMCFDRVENGNGMVFGIERSGYMDEYCRKRFILEIEESEKMRIDSAIDLRNLPYPSDLFDHVFHVNVFYFLQQEHLFDINRELLRVLKPGAKVFVGMQFSKLKELTKHNILHESQWDPLRYLKSLEDAKFQNVQIEYQGKGSEEYQVISAMKPSRNMEEDDPEEMMKQLEMIVKKERLAVELMKNRKNIDN